MLDNSISSSNQTQVFCKAVEVNERYLLMFKIVFFNNDCCFERPINLI